MAAHGGGQLFRLILIKPSHYDDDGYVIQWLRSPIPANSLACLYGLARDCRERQVLGPDIDLDIVAIDETNTRIRPDKIARQIKAADQGLVMLVASSQTSFREPSTSPPGFGSRTSRSALAGSTSPARWQCSPALSQTCSARSIWAASSMQERPRRAGSTLC